MKASLLLKAISLSCGFFLTLCRGAFAQEVIRTTEHLDSDRPEAWAMQYFTSVSLLAGLGTPYGREPGSIELGFELDWIPKLGKAEKRVGFNGLKEVDLNKAPIFARPRLTLGLPWKFALTLSYLPPITVFGVTPDLFAFALERPIYESTPWTIGVRAYGQVGTVEGAFTCPGDVAKFPPGSPQNRFGCEEKSSDITTQRYGGLELSASYRLDRMRGLTPYFAVAGNYLDNKFRTRALTFGIRDRTRLVNDTWTFSTSAGVTYPLTNRLNLSVGLFYSPLWVRRFVGAPCEHDPLFNVRAMISYRLR